MFTKEELLEKGVPADAVDEIIGAFSDSEDSLLNLQKALEDEPETGSLFKAEKGEEDKDEDDEDDEKGYNAEYMKKYMKRYMKENKGACKKMMKDSGLFGSEDKDGEKSEMKKALEGIDLNAEGAIVEMTDLAPYLNSQSEFNENMVKAMSKLADQVDYITEQTEKSFELMQKAARVQIDQSKELKGFLSTPQGRKGVVANVEMKKAIEPTSKFSSDDNRIIYSELMKAVKGGSKEAGMVISAFESAGHNANRLNNDQKKYIYDMITKEAN